MSKYLTPVVGLQGFFDQARFSWFSCIFGGSFSRFLGVPYRHQPNPSCPLFFGTTLADSLREYVLPRDLAEGSVFIFLRVTALFPFLLFHSASEAPWVSRHQNVVFFSFE